MQPTVTQMSYNWSTARKGNAIVAIVAHGTAGTDSRAYLARGGELADGSDRKVSIHILIQKDGAIYRYVPDELGANHAGYGTMPPPWRGINPNLCTLGFELENLQDGKDPYPTAQLTAMAWQINQWRAKHGPLPIYRHADIDPHRRSDTVGLSVDEMEAWVRRAGDPLRARVLDGPAGAIFCSERAARFYAARGGLGVCGYPTRDEFASVGQNGQACTILRCERVLIKDGREFALLGEARSMGWLG